MLPSFQKPARPAAPGHIDARPVHGERFRSGDDRHPPYLSAAKERATPVVMATATIAPRCAPRHVSFWEFPTRASQFLPISPSTPSLPPCESPGTSSAPRAMSRTTSPTSTRPPWRTSPATSWCSSTWRRRRRGSSRARRTPRPSPPSPSASARATWPSRNARRGVSSPCTISPPRRARPGSACSRPPTSGPRCASETQKNHPDRPN